MSLDCFYPHHIQAHLHLRAGMDAQFHQGRRFGLIAPEQHLPSCSMRERRRGTAISCTTCVWSAKYFPFGTCVSKTTLKTNAPSVDNLGTQDTSKTTETDITTKGRHQQEDWQHHVLARMIPATTVIILVVVETQQQQQQPECPFFRSRWNPCCIRPLATQGDRKQEAQPQAVQL